MKEFFALYPIAAWSLVSVMVAGLLIMLLWEKLKWWWLNTWYSFPIIGKLATLSRDTNKSAIADWFKSERTLCQDYKSFIKVTSEHQYNEMDTYLRKVGDTGRSTTPKFIWLITSVLVVIEALGFSYVLAGFAVPGASENTQGSAAIGLALMLSVVLVGLTHFAGHQLYKSNKIRAAKDDWKSHDPEKYRLMTEPVTTQMPQNIDDDQPSYTQICNRMGSKNPSYFLLWVTAVIVILVAIGATYVRGKVLDEQLTVETTGRSESTQISLSINKDGLDLKTNSGDQLPAADLGEQEKAENKANTEIIDSKGKGGWVTFIMLGVIFIALQFLAGFFGFYWGFAGKESEKAYRSTGRGKFANYAEYKEFYQSYADVAQSKLENLQQKMNAKLVDDGLKTKRNIKTFENFLTEKMLPTSTGTTSESTAPQFDTVQLVVEAAQMHTVDSVLAQVDKLSDAQAKTDFMLKLPADLRSQAAAAIKERKAAVEKAKADAELEGLFD